VFDRNAGPEALPNLELIVWSLQLTFFPCIAKAKHTKSSLTIIASVHPGALKQAQAALITRSPPTTQPSGSGSGWTGDWPVHEPGLFPGQPIRDTP